MQFGSTRFVKLFSVNDHLPSTLIGIVWCARLDFGYLWNGQILIVLFTLGTLAYGGHLVMNKRLTVSGFVSFILYQQRLGDVLDVMRLSLSLTFMYHTESSDSSSC